MRYKLLGRSGLRVSELALGTMTFGEQNTEQQAFEQLDMALDSGVNFIDTAEMYSVPPREETMGSTERIIGRWLRARGCRDRVVIATKVAGPGRDPKTGRSTTSVLPTNISAVPRTRRVRIIPRA